MRKDEQSEAILFLEKKCGKLSVEYNLFKGICDMINVYRKNSEFIWRGIVIIDDSCYLNATNAIIAEFLRANENTVKHAIKKCERMGIIEVRTERGYRSKLIRPINKDEMMKLFSSKDDIIEGGIHNCDFI